MRLGRAYGALRIASVSARVFFSSRLTSSSYKGDGWRIVAYKARERIRLITRKGVDHTRVASAAISKLSARALVLDGEVGSTTRSTSG